MKHFHILTILCILCLLMLGCGQPLPEGMPRLYPVTLSFTQDGKPLDEANIVLVPQFDSPWIVGGITDAAGNVQLKTHGKYEGAPAGKFKICVSKTISEGELPPMDSTRTAVPMRFFEAVELQYKEKDTTPLEIDIESKETEMTFDVGKVVKIRQVGPPM